MKALLIIFFLFLCVSSIAQMSKKDSLVKSVNIKQKILKTVDSIVVGESSDTFFVKQPLSESPTIKVILSKKHDSSDGWFIKYAYPVVLLLVGVMIPLLIESFNEGKRIRKVGERWTAEIRSLENPIKIQIDAIEKYLVIHNQDNLIFPDFQIIEGLGCEIFQSLDKSELLKFLEKNRVHDYGKAVNRSNHINGFINIVKGSNTNLKQKFKEYSDQVSSYIMKVTENLTALSRASGNYGVLLEQELNKEPIADPRFIAIQNLFDNEIEPFRESGKYEIYRLHDNFLVPFLSILYSLRHDSRTNEMSTFVGKCIDAVKGIKMEKYYMKENFETIISRYNENLSELPEIIRLVEEVKKVG